MSVEKTLTVVMVTDFQAPDFRMTILLRVTGLSSDHGVLVMSDAPLDVF